MADERVRAMTLYCRVRTRDALVIARSLTLVGAEGFEIRNSVDDSNVDSAAIG